MSTSLENKSILLVISGGIAAYKALELIRLVRKSGGNVRCILTKGGAEFVTPLSVSALSENAVYTDLWSLKDETEMGHIRLSREADLIVVVPCSAHLIAQMANGLAGDLASTTLLASTTPALIAPAMNHAMWNNPATQDNISKLQSRGVHMIGPIEGDMACGEYGMGRMAEPEEIFQAIQSFFFDPALKGKHAIVTAGPTFEPIDPVRFLGNRSSGRQGYAIARELQRAGAEVTLISGPTSLPPPPNIKLIQVETAQEMLAACEAALPASIAICSAAVSDWSPETPAENKIKKHQDNAAPEIKLIENPDILKTLSRHDRRPELVIGFALETENLVENAKEKLRRKGCDWIIANAANGIEKPFGSNENRVYLLTNSHKEEPGHEEWPRMTKEQIAKRIVLKITESFITNDRHAQAAE